jgi:fused signal recognition particle receptor
MPSLPWGPITFVAVAIAFALLVILAVVRMRHKRAAEEAEESGTQPTDEEIEAEVSEAAAAAGQIDEDEEPGDGEQHAPATAEKPPKKGHGPRPTQSRTIPDTPHALDEESKSGVGRRGGAEGVKAKGKAKPKPIDHGAERERLTVGLAKTRGGFIARLGALFRGKAELEASMVEQIEEILFTADIGVATSHELIEDVRREVSKKELARPEAVWEHIKKRSAAILDASVAPPLDLDRARPFVILVVGVNGTGKTTTIGKLAARIREEGRTVLLAAGDTFRAAAAEQLQIWGDRAQVEVVKGKEGADPSSVIIDALKRGQEAGVDVVLADTAGRLHTKVNLMEEIQKVRRSIGKRVEGAPHETFLVLDATTGQNAIAQAKMFKDAVDITGIILTKLDGTAKGGVVLGICNELKIPVRYIGIGERAEDLRDFDPQAFVEALYQEAGTET